MTTCTYSCDLDKTIFRNACPIANSFFMNTIESASSYGLGGRKKHSCFHLGAKVDLRIRLFGWLNWIINLESRISLFCIVVKDSSYKVKIGFSLSTFMILWQEFGWEKDEFFCSSPFRKIFRLHLSNKYYSERSTILDLGYKPSAMNAEFLEFSSIKAPNAMNRF